MERTEKIEAYFSKEHLFKDAIAVLRRLLKETKLEETYKWNFPTYTLNNKNVIAICRFNHHFGFWFFNGVFLKDPHKVLVNAQEGKTKAMRHWKFTSKKEINPDLILTYIQEAIQLEEKGLKTPRQLTDNDNVNMPKILSSALQTNSELHQAYNALSPYKQKEYKTYINSAKQVKTKASRLKKIIPMILQGKSLNDRYR
ncbi:YdeI family protein [Maribacter chungangensis]|uniref:YdeI family protein n=1 Tax=Maribacter chungangensis TaxID=1069117 RepID=A0ABW3B1E2_9FLAO